MISNKTLHYLSYLKFVFFIWMMALTVYAYIIPPNKELIPITGNIMLLLGVFMGFEGLSDVERLSEREKKKLSNPKHVKRLSVILFIAFIGSIVLSLYFFFLKYIFKDINPDYLSDFKRLGSDCLVMGLGFLCLLKLLYDQEKYVKSLESKTEE
ncbi:MAG: hypothetical protein EHM93_13555 [Bacteroidales bacterium]|nr:MAG: hypothetical protein EHM93_13555 [Bacteroidales bacterium]